MPGGAVYAAGYRNADIAADPYDNNTGQADQTRVTNTARGLAVTAQWAFAERLTARMIASVRRSEYEAGLDDDGFFDDFLRFPEEGEADQASVEAQLLGELGGTDFVAGVYHFSEDGSNVQDPTVFLGFRGAFQLVGYDFPGRFAMTPYRSAEKPLGGQCIRRAVNLCSNDEHWEIPVQTIEGFTSLCARVNSRQQ